jgi:hypothetical protein
LRSVQEEPHSEGFGALYGDEAAMAADVILVLQSWQRLFVGEGVSFELEDSFLKRVAKTRAYNKFFAGLGSDVHTALLMVPAVGLPYWPGRVVWE